MAKFQQRPFKLKTPFEPKGDQPEAIKQLTKGVLDHKAAQVLLGVTGSGKTFTMANLIANTNKPTLILSHNKTLAAQLFTEFREFFPENAVEYFVSYYDYFQPEAYIPSTDTYIEKDSQINDEIDKLRHSATRSLLLRNDVIIVSSVSCIYGLGSPEAYEGLILYVEEGQKINRQVVLKKLVEIQYRRNDVDFHRGTFRVRGEVIEVFPAYEEEIAIRIEFFDDEIEGIYEVDPLRGTKLQKIPRITVFPGSHYVTTLENRKRATETIRDELRERLQQLQSINKSVEAQRLEQRTFFDLEMMEELGFCQGIENYSRHLTGRNEGDPPPTLIDYFPKNNWLLIVDESHVSIPQIGGMYRGDRARKMNLVEHGFRLPSALDNRPLNFEEFEKIISQAVYVSATPGDYELNLTHGEFVEQVIRPTGLVDPPIVLKPATQQVDDLLQEIKLRVEKKERVLVTVLTKKLAEELSRYYVDKGVKVKYLHSDIDTLERVEILRDLRLGLFDVLVGINLLREGLDLPEVSLVAILDADKEGFLRSHRSLIQTIGRAARNINGTVLMYADKITKSMQIAIDETNRRRKIQEDYNEKNGITPQGIQKAIRDLIAPDGLESSGAQEGKGFNKKEKALLAKKLLGTGSGAGQARRIDETQALDRAKELAGEYFTEFKKIERTLERMEADMKKAASELDFEKAAELRDRTSELRRLCMEYILG